eukprot:scaffold8103_cov403-Prasinococcus_capsulatus_cf.AAC.11
MRTNEYECLAPSRCSSSPPAASSSSRAAAAPPWPARRVLHTMHEPAHRHERLGPCQLKKAGRDHATPTLQVTSTAVRHGRAALAVRFARGRVHAGPCRHEQERPFEPRRNHSASRPLAAPGTAGSGSALLERLPHHAGRPRQARSGFIRSGCSSCRASNRPRAGDVPQARSPTGCDGLEP